MTDKDMKEVANDLIAKGYPKFQYSIFLKNGDQLVIRAETFEEFIQAKKDINPIIEKSKPEVTQEPTVVPQGLVCPKCGGTMQFKQGTSKAGKPYKGNFCQNPNCKEVTWL